MMFRLAHCLLACVLAIAPVTAAPLGPDGAPGRRLPGKFIWFDLATEDMAGARAFYGAAFGWTFREAAGVPAPYTLIEYGGGKVGGMFHRPRPSGAKVGGRWLSLLSVPDAAKAAQQVRAAGGEVLVGPRLVPGRGTHAVFRDPEGAVFGVLVADGGDPPDTPVADGDFFWLDLFSRDPAKAAAFYAGLAPYDVAVPEPGEAKPRRLLATGGYARAGIVPMPAGAQEPGWLPYVLVDDVPATLQRVLKAGGRIVVAPRADRLDGNVAVIADPSGGVIGVVNWGVPAQAARSGP